VLHGKNEIVITDCISLGNLVGIGNVVGIFLGGGWGDFLMYHECSPYLLYATPTHCVTETVT
jgi:hypothetical protein